MTPEPLLAWYDRQGRDLPWRETDDPYAIWVSEVMLQQTRVETVLSYYERFLARFPDVGALAEAPVEEVLALWSGLGYYRRARQLHRAAGEVAARGGFPRTLEGLLELPGIGAYTAAAVGSIAFGLAEPVVDGNVERVVSRLVAFEGDPKSAAGRRRIRGEALRLLDPSRPGDSNQAMMELGATVCVPKAPRCLLCPLNDACRARAEGRPEAYPRPRRRRAVEKRLRAVAVVRHPRTPERVLLLRRPEGSRLLAGTWELPWVDLDLGTEDPGAQAAERLAERYGAWLVPGRLLGEARHGITHRSFTVRVHAGAIAPAVEAGEVAEPGEAGEAGWFDEAAREGLPLSSLVGKALAVAAAGGEER